MKRLLVILSVLLLASCRKVPWPQDERCAQTDAFLYAQGYVGGFRYFYPTGNFDPNWWNEDFPRRCSRIIRRDGRIFTISVPGRIDGPEGHFSVDVDFHVMILVTSVGRYNFIAERLGIIDSLEFPVNSEIYKQWHYDGYKRGQI